MRLRPWWRLAGQTIWRMLSHSRRSRLTLVRPPQNCRPWCNLPMPSSDLCLGCLLFQTLNLCEVILAMGSHLFYVLGYRNVVFELWMVCRFLEVLGLQA